MTELRAEDKELMAAFAEFKELLRRESEAPLTGSDAPAIDPELATQRRAPPPQEIAAPPLRAEDFQRSRRQGETPLHADLGPSPEARRKLIYLSAAIVIAGVAALGFTLAQRQGSEEQAATARSVEPPSAPEQETATAQPPTDAAAPDAPMASPSEPARAESAAEPSKEAPSAPTEAATTPAAEPSEPAPLSSGETATTRAESAAAGAPPAAASAAPAPLAAPPTPPQPPAAAPAPEPPAAAPATAEKPAAGAKTAKAKPKPAVHSAERGKQRNGKAAQSTPEQEQRAPPATAESAPPPPAPAEPAPAAPQPQPQSDGPIGFVKRTVNSVGSTISNIGRSVIP